MKIVFSFLLIAYCTYFCQSQDTILVTNIGGGIEAQIYPTGFIAGAVFYKELGAESFAHIRLGYNFIRHGDAGVHQDERGSGWGGSLGFDRALKVRRTNVLLGARCDLWFNNLTWRNNIGQSNEFSGKTNVTVVQPTVRLSYPFRIGADFIVPELAFGSEFNVKTSGEEVGEGLILLIGLSYIIP